MNPERNPFPIGVEYVWLGGNNEFRSKVRIMNFDNNNSKATIRGGTFQNGIMMVLLLDRLLVTSLKLYWSVCLFRYPLIGGVFFKLKYIVL